MKSIFAALLIIVSVNTAMAATAQPEFCKMNVSDDTNTEDFFTETSVDVLKAKTLSAKQLALVNAYIIDYGYTDKAMSLEQIKAFFKTEQMFNDLNLIVRTSKETKERHVEVVSYPGDNPVGTLFDIQTGKIIGHNNDDSYSFIVNGKDVYCSDSL